MNKMKWKMLAAAAFIASVATIQSCKNDEDPTPLELQAVTADAIDLNGATSPNNVGTNPVITATFSTNVDATTANNTNVKLVRDYDKADIPLDVTATGNIVTIKPKAALNSGALFKLSITPALMSDKGLPLTQLDRTFSTAGTFAPTGAKAAWTFENTTDDVIGTYDPTAAQVVAITYGDSHNANGGKAAVFNGTTSLIEVSNGDQLMNNGDWALSFWVKPSSANGKTSGHFVMGLGAFYGFQFEIPGDYSNCKLAASYATTKPDAATASTDLWFPGDGKDKDHGGDQGWTFVKDLTGSGGVAALLKDKWAHVAIVYTASTKLGTMYINGQKMKQQDFNLYPDTNPVHFATGLKYSGTLPDVKNELAFGFIQSRAGSMWDGEDWGGYDKPGANHFQGSLDDIYIYPKTISEAEITLIYNSGK